LLLSLLPTGKKATGKLPIRSLSFTTREIAMTEQWQITNRGMPIACVFSTTSKKPLGSLPKTNQIISA